MRTDAGLNYIPAAQPHATVCSVVILPGAVRFHLTLHIYNIHWF